MKPDPPNQRGITTIESCLTDGCTARHWMLRSVGFALLLFLVDEVLSSAAVSEGVHTRARRYDIEQVNKKLICRTEVLYRKT